MSADFCGTRLEGVDLEVTRSALCHILYKSIGGIECLFDESISGIEEKFEGVYVSFEKDPSRLFDLTVDANDLHSNVRELVFGSESNFSRKLDISICVFSFPNLLNLKATEIKHHNFQKFVNLYKEKANDQPTVALAFSNPSNLKILRSKSLSLPYSKNQKENHLKSVPTRKRALILF